MRRLPIAAALAATAIAVVAAASWAGIAGPRTAVGTAAPSFPAGSVLVPTSPPSTIPPTPVPTQPPPPPPPPPPLSPADRPGLAARLQAALERERIALAAPGIQATVLFADGRSWTGMAGFADLATKRPLEATTPFAIASVSKTFLAAEILLLVKEGRVTLDAAVATLLPGTLVGGARIDPGITVRMLLDHTSGLGDYLVNRRLDLLVEAEPTARWSTKRALSFAGKAVGKPGAGYHYANTNYVLLGLIAEQATGHSLAQEYRARFFGPLQMKTASYQGVEKPTAQLPTAYRYASTRLSAPPADATDGSDIRPFTAITTAAGAAGSIAASSGDLARWARALYAGGLLPNDLLAAMLDDAAHTATLKPAARYGLGVQVQQIDGRTTYGHSGRLVGARSVVRWFPTEGIAIAIVSNQARFDLTPVLKDLLTIVAPQQVGGGLTLD
ncbi:MAG: serine hydrolase domain-containing protein [Candidatus Limnocylindrales bacterium]